MGQRITAGSVVKDCTLKVGDFDYAVFQPNDPPPFYELKAQRYDRPMTVSEKRSELVRRTQLRESKLTKKRRLMRDLEATLSEEEEVEFTEAVNPFVVYGYVGKPKGSRMYV